MPVRSHQVSSIISSGLQTLLFIGSNDPRKPTKVHVTKLQPPRKPHTKIFMYQPNNGLSRTQSRLSSHQQQSAVRKTRKNLLFESKHTGDLTIETRNTARPTNAVSIHPCLAKKRKKKVYPQSYTTHPRSAHLLAQNNRLSKETSKRKVHRETLGMPGDRDVSDEHRGSLPPIILHCPHLPPSPASTSSTTIDPGTRCTKRGG